MIEFFHVRLIRDLLLVAALTLFSGWVAAAVPSVTINSVSVAEGNSGSKNLVFTLSLSEPGASPVTVSYATSNGTATAGADYVSASGTVSFPSSQTSRTISVSIIGDVLSEADETFFVNLSNPVNATLATNAGTGTILDNDPLPSLAINNASVTEGDGLGAVLTFTLTLSTVSGQEVTVNYETADGTATGGLDYFAVSGAVSFSPGTVTQIVDVVVAGDRLDEVDETVFLNLSSPGNVTLSDTQGVGTILDDDPVPVLTIGDTSVLESDSVTAQASFSVQLSAPSGRTVTVGYATASGSATSGSDFITSSGTVTFLPGVTNSSVVVEVIGDLIDETNETFVVNLSNPVAATILDAQGTATIFDNDPQPTISINGVTVVEGNSGTTGAIFTVSLSLPSGRPITVNFATSDGSALAGTDFFATNGTLTFSAGATQQRVTVSVIGDSIFEGAESFLVNLSGAVNASLADAQGVGFISEDDPVPLTIGDAVVVEGNSGITNLVFTVSLAALSGQTVSVNYATANGTAVAGSDYVGTNGTVTFLPGEMSKTIVVSVVGDVVSEADETLLVNLSGAVNATLSDGQGLGTIQNDDAAPLLSIGDAVVVEGNSGITNLVFTVSLALQSGQTVSVNYASANGTAVAGSDYVGTNGTVTFLRGEVSKTIVVNVVGDVVSEVDETMLVNLSGAVNATLSDSQGLGTIQNDDALPALSINDVSVSEGNSGTISALFTVTLAAQSGQTVSVNYATANETAVAGSDYVGTNGTVTFLPGEVSKTIVVNVVGDVVSEVDETMLVNLSGAANATLGDGQGVGTIQNDDAAPLLAIGDAVVVEGNSGITNLVFTVSLAALSGQTVSVNYATANGTAVAGSDYVGTNGTVTFLPGEMSKSIVVSVVGDGVSEADEMLLVNLSGAVNATLSDGQGLGTIQNDDAAPLLSIGDAVVVEGNSGITNLVFTVSLALQSGQTVSVNYASANGTAVAGSDYVGTNGTVTFLPGEMSKTIAVSVVGDVVSEADETMLVNLSGAVNATLSDSQGLGTIQNDDALPALSINDVSVSEGNSGTVSALFTVSLALQSGQTVSVNYATANGTAVAGSDYVGTNGTVTFLPGEVSKTIVVSVVGDVVSEADETMLVNLSGAVNATLSDSQGLGTIQNDDAAPLLSIGDAVVVEGNSGITNLVFTVSLVLQSGQTVSVNYATANGTAVAGSDYVGTNGTVTFLPGVTNRSILVAVLGDLVTESDETFTVNLSGAVNATLSGSQGMGTIQNDDPVPALSINDVSVVEGNSGTTGAVFTVTLSRPSVFSVSVGFSNVSATALSSSDFFATVGTLSFPAGITSQVINVTVIGDLVNELNETFLVNLAFPINATIADGQGVGTIVNDDPVPAVSINDVAVMEGDSGTQNLIFTVNLSASSAQTVTVNYATTNGLAIAGVDYVSTAGTLTFNPSVTNQVITVTVLSDLLDEADETLFVNLNSPVNATLADAQGTGTILDNDLAPSLRIEDAVVGEGNVGTTNLLLSVNLSAPSELTVSAAYLTSDGSALAASDYVATNGTISFPPGTTNRTITVAVRGDTVFETAESFFVSLTNATNVTFARAQAVGTILDNETLTAVFTNAAPINLPLWDPVTPYPSTIQLSGLPGQISRVGVTLVGIAHTVPDDLDILLVGPGGRKVLLMSDAGGSGPITDVNLSFDDSASGFLPDAGQISSGTFKASDYAPTDSMPLPAPPGPYSNALSAFAGLSPNGTWSLFVYDDTFGAIGDITGGWRLTVSATNLVCCASGSDADVSVTLTDSPDPALNGFPVRYTLLVVNSGPASATSVMLTNPLPAGVTFGSASASQGSCSFSAGIVTCSLGTLAIGAAAQVNVTVIPPDVGLLTNTATVAAASPDNNVANNTATAVTMVTLAPPSVTVGDVAIVEPNVTTATAVFTVSLSRTNDAEIRINYETSNGSATAGSDYVLNSGILVFPAGVTNRTVAVVVNGDSLVEPNETFFVNLSNPPNAIVTRSSATGTIINDDAIVGQLDHFVWDSIPSPQYRYVPFPVVVRAVDVNGTPATSFNGVVELDGLVGPATGKSILITEVDTDVDRVEFVNVTRLPFDLSGWQVSLYDWISWPDPRSTFTFPTGTICQAQQLFTLEDNGTYPGTFPQLFLGANVAWGFDVDTNQVAVVLRNAAGQIVDFMCAVDGFASELSYPTPIPTSEWSGSPVAPNINPALTYQRTGTSDHNNNSDWTLAGKGIGSPNAGLTVPFPSPQLVAIDPSTSGNFPAGVWSGMVTVLEPQTNMYLRTDDTLGHLGTSGQFTVLPTTDLGITNSGPPSLVSVGQIITYQMMVTNRGPITATGVFVTNTFPGPVTYQSATSTQGTVSRSGDTVTVNIGSLAVNASVTINVNLRPDAPGPLSNSATVISAVRDYYPPNNFSTAYTDVNFPPTISAISDQIIIEDASTAALAFNVGDVETLPGSLVVAGYSSNTNLLPATNMVFGGSGSVRTITLTPRPNQSGLTTNTVSVSDGLATVASVFVLTVLPVNDPPVFAKGTNLTMLEDSALTMVAGWATGISPGPSDESGQVVDFVVTNDSNLLFANQPAISPSGVLTCRPATNAHGTANVTVRLHDNGGIANGGIDLSAPQSFTITVINRPVLRMPSIVGSQVVLSWSALAGMRYRLEQTADLNGTNWVSVPGDVTATSAIASKTNGITLTNHFHRVRVLP